MCLDLCSKLGDSARRRIVTRKCNQELRARSLPTAASTTIYVAQKHDVPMMKAWLRRTISGVTRFQGRTGSWLFMKTRILVKSRCQAHRIGKRQSSDFHFELLGAHRIKRPQQRTHTRNSTSKRQQRHRPLVGLFGLQFKNQWLQRLVHGAKIVRFLGLAVEKTVDSECAATHR